MTAHAESCNENPRAVGLDTALGNLISDTETPGENGSPAFFISGSETEACSPCAPRETWGGCQRCRVGFWGGTEGRKVAQREMGVSITAGEVGREVVEVSQVSCVFLGASWLGPMRQGSGFTWSFL